MAVISMKSLLDAGVHLGHQTRRWHPLMAPYIFANKGGIHIIDLRKTLHQLKEAYEFIRNNVTEGKEILFVGTKPQIQKVIQEEALTCNSPYINYRWLGGLLTNFTTVRQSVARLKQYEELRGKDGKYEGMLKKEALQMERKRIQLIRSLGGVQNMKRLPAILFIVDCKRERIAIQEAKKLGIPIVAILDTNCDPTGIDYVIPGNDDSPRAVKLFASVLAAAIQEGKSVRSAPPVEAEITEETFNAARIARLEATQEEAEEA